MYGASPALITEAPPDALRDTKNAVRRAVGTVYTAPAVVAASLGLRRKSEGMLSGLEEAVVSTPFWLALGYVIYRSTR